MAASRSSDGTGDAAATPTTPKSKSKTKTKKNSPTKSAKKTKSTPQTPTKSTPESTTPDSDHISTPKSTGNRVKSPGIRVKFGRIYDSVNGKSCHQCRQKTWDFSLSCTATLVKDKKCTLHFCYRCLLNRYRVKAEDVAEIGDWTCPKCSGICNCSYCMRKLGRLPTGFLPHSAKANGLLSGSGILDVESSLVAKTREGGSSKKRNASNKELVVESTRKRRKVNSVVEISDAKEKPKSRNGKLAICDESLAEKCDNASVQSFSTVFRVSKKVLEGHEMNYQSDNEVSMSGNHSQQTKNEVIEDEVCNEVMETEDSESDAEFPLVQGTELTRLPNIDMDAGDIGHALQFLEFCETFREALDLKEGHSELLLQELSCGKYVCSRRDPSLAQFQIKLLSFLGHVSGKRDSSLIGEDENLLAKLLERFISKSNNLPIEFLIDFSGIGPNGYEELSFSKKLRLLNFLCDEVLGTEKLRTWIIERNLEEKRKAKQKIIAEREKRNYMKTKMLDELASAILLKSGPPLSISEHEKLVSDIKVEAAQTLAETVVEPSLMEGTSAARSEPICTDATGRRFWKLKGYSNKVDILLQDVSNGDLNKSEEKWFVCNVDEKALIENYVSTLR